MNLNKNNKYIENVFVFFCQLITKMQGGGGKGVRHRTPSSESNKTQNSGSGSLLAILYILYTNLKKISLQNNSLIE
jgi:hypothetical protein